MKKQNPTDEFHDSLQAGCQLSVYEWRRRLPKAFRKCSFLLFPRTALLTLPVTVAHVACVCGSAFLLLKCRVRPLACGESIF